ncbi:SusC/RagA family TonB-linked outer membrane protein [Aquimarina algiphila]|uniref:SusC/RagA family TonB-linked outer membrane protein n=1 Tax=Aquimarina algiphila TaxID=2047982 RepID=UPI00232E3147|nr:TonB-dependent receptor [Aquimarina algiphila]
MKVEKALVIKIACRKWLPILLLILYSGLYSQTKNLTVEGTITGDDGVPIPGAIILVKGTTKGAISDFDGNYSIEAKIGDFLVFSYIGFQEKTLQVDNSILNIVLLEKLEDLDEVIVIGYGTQRKKELTGAVAQVKAEEIENVITGDIASALQGQIAGVSVTASSGEPGEGSGILIRGISSLTGSNAPLFVVDGVPQSGDPGLNPNEIETIDVLKDAASASIYGTRAAGGVILITTKKGKSGNTEVSLEITNGLQVITRQTPLMNTQEQIFFDLNDPTRAGSAARGDRFSLLNDNDLRDLTENDLAEISRYNVGVSGGAGAINYSIVLGFFNQEGIVINSGLKRYNLRTNLNIKKDKWTINNGFGFTIDDRERPNFNLLILGQRAFPFLDEVSPSTIGVINENDENSGSLEQILEALTRDRKVGRYRFEASSNIKYKINEHFEFSTLISGVITNQFEKQVQPPFSIFDSNGINIRNTFDSFVFEERDRQILLNFNAGLNYKQYFGKHGLSALALVNVEQDYFTSIAAVNRGLSFSSPSTLSLGSTGAEVQSFGDISIGGPFFTEPDHRIKRVGTVGRLFYDYDSRYLVSLSARVDASNQFSKDNLYAFFPSASVGWNISDEKFWGNLNRTINNFKLRASIGTTGNDRIPANSIFSPINTGFDANLGNSLNPGFAQGTFGNPTLKWEVTTQKNIGVDLGLWKSKLTLTADYYETDKKDLLIGIPINPSFGARSAITRFQGSNEAIFNIGNLTNTGFEAALRYRPKTGNVRWNILGTFATNKNKVTSIDGNIDRRLFGTNIILGDVTARAIGLQVGREAGSFLLFETDGLLRTQDEVDTYNAQFGENVQIGDLKYIDTNGNGTLRDDGDRVYKGSGLPDYELGLNIQATYKNWFFATNWYASVGNEVYNATRANAIRAGRHKDLLYQFIPGVNENTPIPAFRNRTPGDLNFNGSSDFFLEDGSFIRLRNVVVSFTIPKEVTEKMGFSGLNIYANAQNVLTITKYTGLDPEVGGNDIEQKGIDRGLIPVSASFNLGLRLNF